MVATGAAMPPATGCRPLGQEPAARASNDDVEAMARALIGHVRDRRTGAVLLDLEVDGTRYRLTRSAPSAPDPRGDGLSPRELEIARMVAMGHANKTIARVLQISSWTVNTHLRRVFGKLGVTTRAAMVARLVDTHDALGLAAVVEPQLDLQA